MTCRRIGALVLLLGGIALTVATLAASWAPESRMTSLNWIPKALSEWADRGPNFRTAVPFLGLSSLLFLGFSLNECRRSFTWTLLGSLVVLTLAECGQLFLPGRSADWRDVGWGVVGMMGGLGLGTGMRQIKLSCSRLNRKMKDKTSHPGKRWFCHQMGARENYRIPLALHQRGELQLLQTDFWIPPWMGGMAQFFGQGALKGRCHPGLKSAKVRSFNADRIFLELKERWVKPPRWERTLRQNLWFEQKAKKTLEKSDKLSNGDVIFSFSYTARALFQWAQPGDYLRILGQIDPGPEEHRWVKQQSGSADPFPTGEPSATYWKNWQREIALAQCVIVNSPWSFSLLKKNGVPTEKMMIIPLAYERSSVEKKIKSRDYPHRFGKRRPLRVLFLGQVIRRKGVGLLLEAASRLREEPVEFRIAGPDYEGLLKEHPPQENLKVYGSVDRDYAANLYREADVFILPTFSDGFGVTQLEAAAQRLPLIVSPYCGEVVEADKNGWVLPKVDSDNIVNILRQCLEDPSILHQFSTYELDWERFSLETLGQNLEKAAEQAWRYAHQSDPSMPDQPEIARALGRS